MKYRGIFEFISHCRIDVFTAIPFVAARSPCPSESFVLRKRNVTAAVVGDDSTCNGADATEVVSRASDLVTSFDHAHISDTGPPCAVHASNLKTMKSNTQVLFTNYTKDSIPFSFNFDVNEDSWLRNAGGSCYVVT